jgi:hypothetical protein
MWFSYVAIGHPPAVVAFGSGQRPSRSTYTVRWESATAIESVEQKFRAEAAVIDIAKLPIRETLTATLDIARRSANVSAGRSRAVCSSSDLLGAGTPDVRQGMGPSFLSVPAQTAHRSRD